MYDTSFDLDAPADQCATAADRMLCAETELVIMGHTHLARRIGREGRRRYINTGTWADLIEVPSDALIRTEAGLECLEKFLTRLLNDSVRIFKPMYADVLIAENGSVAEAELRSVSEWIAEG